MADRRKRALRRIIWTKEAVVAFSVILDATREKLRCALAGNEVGNAVSSMRLNESDGMSRLSLRCWCGMVVRVEAEEGFRRQPARQKSFPGFFFY